MHEKNGKITGGNLMAHERDECFSSQDAAKVIPGAEEALILGTPIIEVSDKENVNASSKVAFHKLIHALGDCDIDVRRKAAESLELIGDPKAIPALINAMAVGRNYHFGYERNCSADLFRVAVIKALTKLDKHAVSTLIAAFANTRSDDVRFGIAEALGSLGAAAAAALPALLDAFENWEGAAGPAVARAFAKISGASAIPALVAKLKDDRVGVRKRARISLKTIGISAVPALIQSLQESRCRRTDLITSNHDCREDVADALGDIKGHEAAQALITELNNVDSKICINMASALGRTDDPAAVPALIDLLSKSSNMYTKACIMETLGYTRDSRATPTLLGILADGDEYLQVAASEALRLIRDATAIPAFIEALSNHNEDLCSSATGALRDIGDPAIIPLKIALIKTLDSIVHARMSRLLVDLASEEHYSAILIPKLKDSDFSAEDQRILGWFAEQDMDECLAQLQVFWCIGQVDLDAIKSASTAIGFDRLPQMIKPLCPRHAGYSLGYANTTLRKYIDAVDGIFDKNPFNPEALSAKERKLKIRVDANPLSAQDRKLLSSGVRPKRKRNESRWTIKAWTALRIVDRYLTLRRLLPEIAIETKSIN